MHGKIFTDVFFETVPKTFPGFRKALVLELFSYSKKLSLGEALGIVSGHFGDICSDWGVIEPVLISQQHLPV